MLEIPIGVGVDLVALECFQEALAAGIVIGVRRPAHARTPLLNPQTILLPLWWSADDPIVPIPLPCLEPYCVWQDAASQTDAHTRR